VAIAAVNGIEYLLTWNCTHIANAHTRPKIEATCRRWDMSRRSSAPLWNLLRTRPCGKTPSLPKRAI
jgi:hypothetical protein